MSETIICKTFKELQEFISKNQNGSTLVAYDVETNARETHSEEHKVIGFSLAFNNAIGCYVPLKALDFEIDPTNTRLIEKKTRALLESSSTMVYNCMHEYIATLNWLNLELPFVEDLFVMVKMMMGEPEAYKGNGGLKKICVTQLGYNNWSDDVQDYFSYIRDLSTYRENLIDLLRKYYEESEIPHLLELIEQIPESELERKTISYEYIPYKVVGTYGSLDSTSLFDVRSYYLDWMKKDSELLGIDLYKGYRYWMDHHYAGYTLERNGAYWNDNKAQEVADWCTAGIFDTHKKILIDPLTLPMIKTKTQDDFFKHLMQNHSYLISPEYVPVNLTKTTVNVKPTTPDAEKLLRSMSLIPKKATKKKPGPIYSLRVGNFAAIIQRKKKTGAISEDTYNTLENEFYNQFLADTIATKDLEVMKDVFNPNSNTDSFKAFVSSIVITDDIKIAKLYFDLIALTETQDFDIDFFKDFYDIRTEMLENEVKYQKYFKIKDYKLKNPQIMFSDTEDSRLLDLVLKLSKMDSKNKFRIFKKHLIAVQNDLHNPTILRTIKSAVNYKLPKLNDDNIIELYKFHKFSGIDIDNRDTWTSAFGWLFNFRWYRKYDKILGTYINGKNGRESVWYTPKDKYKSGEYYTKRMFSYYSDMGEYIRKHPEELAKYDTVLQTEFKVDHVATGRWSATMHTMPAGSTVKGIVQSRYKGGVIAMPDCSQAEVRVLARLANEQNLMQAYRDGLDIHRYIASLVFQKDIKDVTSRERKVAKSAVFGILYGESEQSFAATHFGGDVKKAHEVFEYVYRAFPGIKVYVDKCHEDFKKYGKVTLPIIGRYLDLSKIDNGRDKDKALRQSQNYPVQGSASDLAGLILYKICEYIKEHTLKSKPFCIIHDSIETDLHPDETFRMFDVFRPLFNEFPDEEFGIPMASDMVFSCNMGSEIEVDYDEHPMVHDEDYNDVWITLSGFESDINDVMDNWKSVYDLVEEDPDFEKEESEELVPLEGLFQEKVVISPDMGHSKKKIKQRYHIIRKLSEVNV
jgi:DNA polymerase I-like protein with 3'-5' exonuclease and polymerase domains